MEGLAPPLKCLIQIQSSIANGESVRSAIARYLQIVFVDDPFAFLVRQFMFAWEQGHEWRAMLRNVESPHRRALIEVLACGLAGQINIGSSRVTEDRDVRGLRSRDPRTSRDASAQDARSASAFSISGILVAVVRTAAASFGGGIESMKAHVLVFTLLLLSGGNAISQPEKAHSELREMMSVRSVAELNERTGANLKRKQAHDTCSAELSAHLLPRACFRELALTGENLKTSERLTRICVQNARSSRSRLDLSRSKDELRKNAEWRSSNDLKIFNTWMRRRVRARPSCGHSDQNLKRAP